MIARQGRVERPLCSWQERGGDESQIQYALVDVGGHRWRVKEGNTSIFRQKVVEVATRGIGVSRGA